MLVRKVEDPPELSKDPDPISAFKIVDPDQNVQLNKKIILVQILVI